MNQEKFKEVVHSSFNNIYIKYMTDVEAYASQLEGKAFNKDEYEKIEDYGHSYTSHIGKKLRSYLNDINDSPITEEQKEEARQTLYRNESAFHSAGVKLEINIKNRFGKSPE